MRTLPVADEPFRMPTLPGRLRWTGAQGFYSTTQHEGAPSTQPARLGAELPDCAGQEQGAPGGGAAPLKTVVSGEPWRAVASRPGVPASDHLQAELHFRRFPLWHYAVHPISGNKGVYWKRTGRSPASLCEYGTDRPVPESLRGETLGYYVTTFRQRFPDQRLVAILSFGDAGVNENRGLLTPQALLWVPHRLTTLATPRPWLVCWQTGLLSVDWLCVEGQMWPGDSKPLPVRCTREPNACEDVLPALKWALTGLPVILDGRPNEEVVYQLDDDLRHLFLMPRKDELYILEQAILEARERGWHPGEPLEVDLSLYGEPATTIAALQRAGYRQVYRMPALAGEWQLIARDRILCRPQEAGYGVSILGLCHDGTLGSFVARTQPTERGYFGPSVMAQIKLVAPYFANAFILDEGLDPTFYDLRVPPEEFPVRGQANGRLSTVLCLYEIAGSTAPACLVPGVSQRREEQGGLQEGDKVIGAPSLVVD